MSQRNLDAFFRPKSIAVIGAGEREGSLGATVLRNVMAADFRGPIYPVNPKHSTLQMLRCYSQVGDLPSTPDSALICAPPAIIPDLIDALGRHECRAAVIMTTGTGNKAVSDGTILRQQMLERAKPYGLRLLGPNCIGLQAPGAGVNASFAHLFARSGPLAFVSQSSAMMTTVLDWAAGRGVGFSHLVSLGDMSDVDFGDLLDYLAVDPATAAILLYMESMTHARKFMSAARAASRLKPLIIIKGGRFTSGARAVPSHSGALAGSDEVYEAAFRRAGALRVFEIQELFAAAETLAFARPMRGERLAILTNGGGLGVLAVDCLMELGGALAELSEGTYACLDQVLPPAWSHANPIDIIGDASYERYRTALVRLLESDDCDAVLVMNGPTGIASSVAAANAVIETAAGHAKPIFTCWAGESTAIHARERFAQNAVPTYETPEHAVRGFMHRARHARNQRLLNELPTSAPEEFRPHRVAARTLIRQALNTKRQWLTEFEAKSLLQAYAIPMAASVFAASPAAAYEAAQRLGGECALKVVSSAILHKSAVGGVALSLTDPGQVKEAAIRMLARLTRELPEATIEGFTVQEMIRRPDAQELTVGLHQDPLFGSVVLFGQGGVNVELIKDTTLELPPLNMALALEMISRTRVARVLKPHSGWSGVDVTAVGLTLVKLAQLAMDFPEIAELEINPLVAHPQGILALDARVRLRDDSTPDEAPVSAICPYPSELEHMSETGDSRFSIRPVRPEDAREFQKMFREVSAADIRMRFFHAMKSLPDDLAARLTQIDYDREMALVATREQASGARVAGVVRIACDPDLQRAEFAVFVRTELKHHGLGTLLMNEIIAYARHRGVSEIFADVMRENLPMLELCRRLGFKVQAGEGDEGVVKVSRRL